MRRHAATACVVLLASLLAGCLGWPVDGTPCGDCLGGTFCDQTTNTCVRPVAVQPICTVSCFKGQVCDPGTNKCRNLCQPACAATEFCHVSDGKGACSKVTCAYPSAWAANVQKVSKLQIADTSTGCDLDGDGKPNNVLGKVTELYKDANTQLAHSVADGTTVLLLEAVAYSTDKTPFSLRWLSGVFDKQQVCDPLTATCDYTIAPGSYDKTAPGAICPAQLDFANAKVDADVLTASSDAQQLPVTLPIFGMALALHISKPSLQGATSGVATWETTKSGMVCGYVTWDDLSAAVDAIPTAALAKIGGPAAIKSQLLWVFKPDIPSTPGGPKDAISVALDFETIPAHVTGLAAP